MPGRTWKAREADGYRYGFGGHEESNELGDGMVTTEYREMDTRLGRWLSLDPKAAKFAGVSPYVAMGNSPIVVIDPDGGENILYLYLTDKARKELGEEGVAKLAIQTQANLKAACVHNAKVVVFTQSQINDKDFSLKHLDDSDGIVFIAANAEEATKTVRAKAVLEDDVRMLESNNSRFAVGTDTPFKDGELNPETTIGRTGAVSLKGAKEFDREVINLTKGQGVSLMTDNPNSTRVRGLIEKGKSFDFSQGYIGAVALCAAHSFGHIQSRGGLGHLNGEGVTNEGPSWMAGQIALLSGIINSGGYSNFFSSEYDSNCSNFQKMCYSKGNTSAKHTHKPASNNYEANKARNKKKE